MMIYNNNFEELEELALLEEELTDVGTKSQLIVTTTIIILSNG